MREERQKIFEIDSREFYAKVDVGALLGNGVLRCFNGFLHLDSVKNCTYLDIALINLSTQLTKTETLHPYCVYIMEWNSIYNTRDAGVF